MPRGHSRSRSPSPSSSRSHSPSRSHSHSHRHRSGSRSGHRSSKHRDRDRAHEKASRSNRNRDRQSHRRSHRHRSHTSSRSRSRSQSPHRRHQRHNPSQPKHHAPVLEPPPVLPYNARQLTKFDYNDYKALFAEYLDIQKDILLGELGEREVKGRFKRFVTHWNRGELAKGWYDPSRKGKSIANISGSYRKLSAEDASSQFLDRMSQNLSTRHQAKDLDEEGEAGEGSDSDNKTSDSDEHSIVGPLPPGHESSGKHKRSEKAAVTMPTVEDLDLQKEQLTQDRIESTSALRVSRKADRALQKEQLDELLPRAAPGTRERQLEKKKELNEKLRSFREKSPEMEVGDHDMMGGGGSDSFKQLKAAKERRKNERELRKEAILRQRMEEREVKLRRHREKEERTIAMLRALAESAGRMG